MKNFCLLFFVLMITKNLNAQIVASIELSNPITPNGITFFNTTDPNAEGYTEAVDMGGQQCRKISVPSKYAYFNASDTAITQADNNLIFHITFFDNGSDFFYLHYNATSNQNYKAIVINKAGSNAWVTATIALTDASFRNAQNNVSDFRISGGPTYIKTIEIEKGVFNPDAEPVVNTTASSYSEFMGKSVAGYQAWFRTGTPTTGWVHWNNTVQPSPNNLSFEVYPDVSEYNDADLTQTGFANLGNGEPSKLFNSTNKGVIDTHFKWIKDKGIDGMALQRFINSIGSVIVQSDQAHPVLVKKAAEANEKIFYICYDITSTGLDATWDDIIKFDWVYNIEQNYDLINSPAYAKVGNKPVVQLWGTGFTGNHPGTVQETIALIEFLQARGCYVIGGVPTHWRNGTGDSKSGFMDAYKAYDMLSPWSAGRYNSISAVDTHAATIWTPDKAFCDTNSIYYMPCAFPGFAWSNWTPESSNAPNLIPRLNGEFLWRQAYKMKELGLNQMYIGMFDEYDEGTNIMNGATDFTQIPTNQYFLTHSADGMWLSSDFYLRLTGEATSMIKSSNEPYTSFNTAYSVGPVYYRNSFEKRAAKTGAIMNLDPCFYNPAVVSSTGVSGAAVTHIVDQAHAKSGLYTAKITGNAASATSASYYYKIADVKIAVKQNMAISFWKYTDTELGKYASIDLKFASGKVLSGLNAYLDDNGLGMHPNIAKGTVGAWEQISCQIGKGELVGDVITQIIIAYDQPAASGSFTAYFDDILIEDKIGQNPVADEIISVTGPDVLTTGQVVELVVEYSATQQRDINLILQSTSDWSWPLQEARTVEAGTGTLTFSFTVDAGMPESVDLHQWVTWISTVGGSWGGKIGDPSYVPNVDVQSTLSVSNSSQENKLLIYPNPSGSFLNIKLSSDSHIQIFSLEGKLLIETKVSSNDLTILDVSNLAQGLYVIKSADNVFKPIKFIKK